MKDHPETEYVQLQLNYLDWDDAALREKDCYELATRQGKPVILMEPIKKGGGACKYPGESGRDIEGFREKEGKHKK